MKSRHKKSITLCPQHKIPMKRCKGPYGYYWRCTAGKCDIVCGGSPHSSPANQETRTTRRLVHIKFDIMWKGKSHKARGRAYKWLQELTGLTPDECHIGLFNMEQCRVVLAALRERQDTIGRALDE